MRLGSGHLIVACIGVGLLVGCRGSLAGASDDGADTDGTDGTDESATDDSGSSGSDADGGSGQCGDGNVDPDEDCDDGNQETEPCENGQLECTVCAADCTEIVRTPVCGDGVRNTVDEECDDGNQETESCDYGETECLVCNSDCKELSGATSYCGDGVTDEGSGEVCDSGDDNDKGPGLCTSSCLAVQTCGDGEQQGTETCDAGADNGVDGNCDLRCGLPWFLAADAADGGDGLSWATAFASFETAMSALSANGGGELWVKAGAYSGDTYFRTPEPVVTFVPYVRAYGGFAGTEQMRADRDWTANKTILQEGVHNVVAASFTRIDGFWIQDADVADFYDGVTVDMVGGGLYAVDVEDLEVVNCTFQDNHAFLGGAAMYLENTSATLQNVTVLRGSLGPSGAGGITATGGTLDISQSVFDSVPGGLGSSAIGASDTVVTIVDSEFRSNVGGIVGPVSITNETSVSRVTNSTFFRNRSDDGSPGFGDDAANGIWVDDSPVVITNVSFILNEQSGFTPVHPDVRGGSGTEVFNAYVHHEFGGTAYSPGLAVVGSCATATGPGGDPPVVADRDSDGLDEYYLNPQSACFDIGDNAAATAAGLDWTQLTTRDIDCLDAGTVDAGRHYVPLSPTAGPCP